MDRLWRTLSPEEQASGRFRPTIPWCSNPTIHLVSLPLRLLHITLSRDLNSFDAAWGELLKLEVAPVELMERCHLFFTFRSRSKDRPPPGTVEKPFAFAYLPLFPNNGAFLADGGHSLQLYRYDPQVTQPQSYLELVPLTMSGQFPPVPAALAKTAFPLRDSMVLRTFLCSTRYTQNEVLLKLLNWQRDLGHDPEVLNDVLTKLRFCSEVEIIKFLRPIFDSLFGILASSHNGQGELDDLVFNALVTILGIVSDRRFHNFKPVLDMYIAEHFNFSSAASHILNSFQKLLADPEAPTLRAALKVWRWLFQLVVRSREVQRAKDVGMGVTSDHLETQFRKEILSVLTQVNELVAARQPSSIIGTQTLAVQNFAGILPDLAKCFSEQELAEIAIAFYDSIAATKGKIVIWKILLQLQLVNSVVFESSKSRAALVPHIVRWVKAHLGKFDEYAHYKPKDPESLRDSARVAWMEGSRLCVSVIAALLDRLHGYLIDPAIVADNNLLSQEQDNVEYALSVLPRLLDSYREFESPQNLEAVQRNRSPMSVVSHVPVTFPASYPFSLLASPPTQDPDEQQQTGKPPGNLKLCLGEVSALVIVMLLLAPTKILTNFLEGALEVEGKDNFGRFLSQLSRVATSILENNAFPSTWLNINILAHRVILKFAGPAAAILEREFIPQQSASYTFNFTLWRDFFTMLLRLLASDQLVIEEFSPQKRRAVWRLAGDVRGEGAKILLRLWDAIGWPGEHTGVIGALTRLGGYQVKFVPKLVEPVLELCLSHHDELRSNAVHVLCEWFLLVG
jgi:dedicator of cytokinesis protein 3